MIPCALVRDGSVVRVFRIAESFEYDDIQHSAAIFDLWNEDQLAAIGIIPLISDAKPDPFTTTVVSSTFMVDGDHVREVFQTSTRSAADIKADLKDAAADKRYTVETSGITVAGATINTSRESQAMIDGAFNYTDKSGQSVRFKGDSGWVTVDPATMQAIALAVGAHVQAAFKAESDIGDLIDAGTVTSLDQVEAWEGWPK